MGIRVKSRSCLLDNNRIICVPFDCSAVFELDMFSFKAKYICNLDESFNSKSIVAIRVGDDIFFVNLFSGAIVKYSVMLQKEIYVRKPDVEHAFANAFYEGHYIYLIPKVIEDTFLVFDFERKIFNRNTEWNSICTKMKISGFIRNAEMDKIGRVVCTVGNSNILFRYDMRKKKIDKFMIGNSGIDLKCIVITENKYYILPNNENRLFIYNLDKNDYVDIGLDGKANGGGVREILINDKLFIQTTDRMDVFDIKKGRFCFQLEMPAGFYSEVRGASLFFTGFYFQGKYYLFPYGANMMLEIDKDYKCIGRELKIENEDIINLCLQNGGMIDEKNFSIENFIGYMMQNNSVGKKDNGELCGEVIYQKIISKF